MDQKMINALNDQINAELFSSYLYFSMSAYFESVNLPGFAGWMRVQAQEELLHVSKFFKYVVDRGGRVVLKAIEEPQKEWKSPLDAFEGAYAHEQKVTKDSSRAIRFLWTVNFISRLTHPYRRRAPATRKKIY